MGDLSKNFSSDEFECPCCGESKMDKKFIKRLQSFRSVMGIKMNIAEGGGYRCDKFDDSKTSAHGEGRAADPMIAKRFIYKAVNVAMAVGMTGIGVKNKSGRFQLHVDDAEEIKGKRPRPWLWTY